MIIILYKNMVPNLMLSVKILLSQLKPINYSFGGKGTTDSIMKKDYIKKMCSQKRSNFKVDEEVLNCKY